MLGFAPADVVYDSPCKSVPELKYALEKGVHLKLDKYYLIKKKGIARPFLLRVGSYALCVVLNLAKHSCPAPSWQS